MRTRVAVALIMVFAIPSINAQWHPLDDVSHNVVTLEGKINVIQRQLQQLSSNIPDMPEGMAQRLPDVMWGLPEQLWTNFPRIPRALDTTQLWTKLLIGKEVLNFAGTRILPKEVCPEQVELQRLAGDSEHLNATVAALVRQDRGLGTFSHLSAVDVELHTKELQNFHGMVKEWQQGVSWLRLWRCDPIAQEAARLRDNLDRLWGKVVLSVGVDNTAAIKTMRTDAEDMKDKIYGMSSTYDPMLSGMQATVQDLQEQVSDMNSTYDPMLSGMQATVQDLQAQVSDMKAITQGLQEQASREGLEELVHQLQLELQFVKQQQYHQLKWLKQMFGIVVMCAVALLICIILAKFNRSVHQHKDVEPLGQSTPPTSRAAGATAQGVRLLTLHPSHESTRPVAVSPSSDTRDT